jgi:hypothetical protein
MNVNYYVARGSEQFGPYTPQEIQSYLAEGRLLGTDLVWGEGMAQWQSLGDLAASPVLSVQPAPPAHALPATVHPAAARSPATAQPRIGGNARGRLLAFDNVRGNGFVSGADGNRYWFNREDWKANIVPRAGLEVDFIADPHGRATQIFVLQGLGSSFVLQNLANASGPGRGVLALVCWFFGLLGIHRFLVGNVGTGIAILLLSITVIGLVVSVVWVFIDFVMILAGAFTNHDGRRIEHWW